MSKESDSSISFGVGLLAGVCAGIVAGILYTPKSGEEMRKGLRDIADKLTEKAPSEVTAATEAGIEVIDRVKSQVELQLRRIHDTIKASRMASAKRKEEAESGVEY